jgi:hypothetical protein
LASLDKGTLFVEHPNVAMKVPAIFGKPATPTPPGVYLITRGYSKQLDLKLLIFRREDGATWAIHPNLKSRERALADPDPNARRLSAGCIGIEQEAFDKLWAVRETMVLQVY